jgi:hypothetical protein
MRLVVVTACACLLTCSASIAADQKVFNDRVVGGETDSASSSNNVTVQPKTLPLDPQPLQDNAAELTTGMPEFKVLADRPIEIPQQIGTAELLAPRDLPLPPERPAAKTVVQRSTDEVCETLSRAAQTNNLPAPFFIRLLFQESGFDPGSVSHAGAQGIAQFMPETAASVGLKNPFDPLQAIPAAARLLRDLVDKFGNLGLAAAAYNAGPGRIHNWLAHKSSLPNETKGYVKIITGVPAEHWKGATQVAAATKLPTHAPCQDIVVASAEPELPVSAPVPVRQPADDSKAVDSKPAARAKTRTAARKAHAKIASAKAEPKPAAHKAVQTAAAKKAVQTAAMTKPVQIAAATKAVQTAAVHKGTQTAAAHKVAETGVARKAGVVERKHEKPERKHLASR